tara:strand:- start:328 stop:564 length:237 start_codon:yes stop_codon:yes gene_type:complete
MKNNKENLYDLANEIYFMAIKGKEKQFIIELEDRSTENTEEGSELYYAIEQTVEGMMKKETDRATITKHVLDNISTLV